MDEENYCHSSPAEMSAESVDYVLPAYVYAQKDGDDPDEEGYDVSLLRT